MDAEEDAYLLALCDEALGEQGLRGQALPWLREGGDPSGAPARVDAWYPQLRVIVLLTRGRDEERSQLVARAGEPYGVGVFEVPRGWVERDAAGTLRRLPAEAERIRSLLGTHEAREDNQIWPRHGYSLVGGYQFDVDDEAAYAGEDLEDFDEEDEEDEGEPDWLDPDAAADALGWRGRSVALALLEAVRLSRRAFEVRRTGSGLSEPAIEALLVLVTAGSPEASFRPVVARELGQLLLRDQEEIDGALRELEAAGHACAWDQDIDSDDPDSDAEWALTVSGHETAVAWIARVLPLFAGWPPDVRGVDDAAAPTDG